MTKLVPSLACLAATLVVSSAFVAGPHRRPLPRLAQQLGDDQQYEADRLRQDEQARAAMRAEAERQYADLRTPWKWVIRKRVWDELEARDIARPPRPVHHRIPNFDGAAEAAARLVKLDEFERAALVKVNPDTPQKAVRRAVLERGKTLLTPQPRLRTGFFSTVTLADVPDGKLAEATTSRGVAKYGAADGRRRPEGVALRLRDGVHPQPDVHTARPEWWDDSGLDAHERFADEHLRPVALPVDLLPGGPPTHRRTGAPRSRHCRPRTCERSRRLQAR